MTERSNNGLDKKDYENSGHSGEEYDLYTEKIKERPFAKHKKLWKLVKLAALSVFAGLVAGVTFLVVLFLGGVSGGTVVDDRQEVVIPMSDYPGIQESDEDLSGSGEMTSEGDSDGDPHVAESGSTEEGNSEANSLDDVSVYTFVTNRASEIDRSMVTVTAIHENSDLLLSVIEQQEDFPGIIVADNDVEYLILTDASVEDVDFAEGFIEVTLFGETKVPADIVMVDSVMSLAVVAVKHEDVPRTLQNEIRIIEMGNSYMLKRGELVIAMGNMYGIKSIVDFGVAVNTKEVAYDVDSRHGLIYTNMNGVHDCAGFIFNEAGQLIGRISPQHSDESIVAYGISDIKLRIQNLTNGKQIAYLGVVGQDIPEDIQKELEMPSGVYVVSIEQNSPAYFAGLLVGDVITDIGGRTISNAYNIERTLCEYESGSTVKVIVNRKGRAGYVPIEYTITLGNR